MQTSRPVNRIDAVDALRGFALAGIVFAHMIEQFLAAPRPAEGWLVEPNLADHLVNAFNGIFIMGKFFSIFAVLFGMSFAIMMGNAAAKGRSFSGRFVWRLAILMLIGFLHSLLYRGDILTVYVAVGFCLPLFYRLPGKVLWAIIILLFLGVGRYLFYLATGTASMLEVRMTPDAPATAAYFEILKNGSFIDVARENFLHGFANKFDFQLGAFGRGYLTLAYFLVGMWLVRVGIVNNLGANKPLIKKVMYWSIAFTVVFFFAMGVSFSVVPNVMAFENWLSVFVYALYDIFNIAFTATLICGFLLLYLRRPTGWLGQLAPYGRVALSNYLLQSLIGTFILYGWGLGLLGEVHQWQMFLLSLVVIFLQAALSKRWLAHFYYGPLEWLWRCGTYFKKVKFARTNDRLDPGSP
jgi:uncharacterized protein